jgi:hypothetical protein
MTLTKSQILSADDLKKETVTVPQWGGDVIVSQFGASERDQYDGKLIAIGNDPKEIKGLRALVCSLCLVDDLGNKLFSPQDVEALGRKSDAALTSIYKVAQRLNGLGPEAQDDAEKNS